MSFIEWLNDRKATQFVITTLGLRRAMNATLRRLPLSFRLPKTGIRYHCPFVDSFMLADEIFRRKVYDPAFDESIRTVCDLGCNVGHFIAALCEHTGRRDLRGLAVDANRDMLREAERLLHDNGIGSISTVFGMVGGPGPAGLAEFYVHPVGIKSSAYNVDEPGHTGKGDWQPTRVPRLDIETLWLGVVGDVPCDLLKVDIEGSEADFLCSENPVLARVERVIVECHRWVIGAEEITARLEAMGFERLGQLDEAPTRETVHFRRRAAG